MLFLGFFFLSKWIKDFLIGNRKDGSQRHEKILADTQEKVPANLAPFD